MDTLLSILLWGGFLFVMMRFGCGSHLFGHKHSGNDANSPPDQKNGGCGKKVKDKAVPEKDDVSWAPPTEDTDPVCGKTVSTVDAKSCEQSGLVYYFCSSKCREKFELAPQDYTKDYMGDKEQLHLK